MQTTQALQKKLAPEILEALKIFQRASSEIIIPLYGKVSSQSKFEIGTFKELFTLADTSSSKLILEELQIKYPGSFSEESEDYINRIFTSGRFENKRVWMIDPLDGSDEFINMRSEYCGILGALLEANPSGEYHPVNGIIHMPFCNESFCLTSDRQVLHLKKDGAVVLKAAQAPTKVQGFHREVDPRIKQHFLDVYQKLSSTLGLPCEIKAGGGAAACWKDLLLGKIDPVVWPVDYSKEWDIAAAENLVKAMGGWISDLDGNPFTYNRREDPFNKRGVMASIAFSKEQILAANPSQFLCKLIS